MVESGYGMVLVGACPGSMEISNGCTCEFGWDQYYEIVPWITLIDHSEANLSKTAINCWPLPRSAVRLFCLEVPHESSVYLCSSIRKDCIALWTPCSFEEPPSLQHQGVE